MDINAMKERLDAINGEISEIKTPLMDNGQVVSKSIYDTMKEIGGDEFRDLENRLDSLAKEKLEIQTQIRVEAEGIIQDTAVSHSDIMEVYQRKAGNIGDAEIEEQVHALETVATADKKRRKAPRTPEMIKKYWVTKIVKAKPDLENILSASEFLRVMGDKRKVASMGKAEIKIINALLPNKGSFLKNRAVGENLR
jgi:hypothetical protein